MDKATYIATFIIGAGVIQGIFQSVVLLGIKKGNRAANRTLAFLLFAFSLNILHSVFFTDILSHLQTGVIGINEPFQFLLGPLMYFYVRQLTDSMKKFKRNDYLHFLPFILYSAVMCSVSIVNENTSIVDFLKSNSATLTTIVWVLVILHFSVYTFLSHLKLKKHHKEIRECYSDIDRINLSWLKFLISVLFCIYLVYFLLLIILFHTPDQSHLFPHFQKIICLVLSFAVYSLGYRGLLQPEVFFAGDESKERQNSAPTTEIIQAPQIKYQRSALCSDEAEELAKQIVFFMEENKPYLNPELTLPELADILNLQRNRLSQVLNEKLGVNFYDFINGYRIREVQRLMADPGNQHLKLLALAFDAGFNSKATFNAIFKKTVGITPSEYQKQLISLNAQNQFTQQF